MKQDIPHSPRETVITALMEMQRRDGWSNVVWNQQLTDTGLSPQDRRFATALFYGTLSRKITIDACIQKYSRRPLDKLDPPVLWILRTAVYQMLYMDSVPARAAIHQGVELTRSFRVRSASGFVNGCLRAFQRDDKQIPLPNGPLAQRWAVEYSFPAPWISLFLEHYGKSLTQEFLESSLENPANFLRVNPLKTTEPTLTQDLTQEGYQTIPTALPLCWEVREGEGVPISQHPGLEQGLFHLQDISSQQAALALQVQPEQRVLDTCAAPGGKTFVLAQEMNNTGQLIATDLHSHRLDTLQKRAHLLGIQNIETHTLDMKEHHPALGTFDRVLCDVPCSGLGVVRRRPEIKYKLPENFSSLPQVQYAILSAGAKYCKSHGLLVYSTCTISPLENQQVVDKFLQNHPNFSLVQGETGKEGTLFPKDQGGDGFFVAVLQCNNH